MKRITIALVLASMCVTGAAFAQEASIAGKQYGMNFLIPTGGKSTAGILYVLSPQMLVELDVGLYWKDDALSETTYDPNTGAPKTKKEANWGIQVAPALRHYILTSGPIAIFLKGGIEISKNKDIDVFVDLAGGLGVEWFVTDQFSLSGDSGLVINLLNHPDNNLGLGTVSHGFSANLYW